MLLPAAELAVVLVAAQPVLHHQVALVEGGAVLTPLPGLVLHPQPHHLPLLRHRAAVDRRVGLLHGADDEGGHDLGQRHAVIVYGDPPLADQINLRLS